MFVEFTDSTETEVVAVFGCRQDIEAWPYQGELADDDPRVLAFIQRNKHPDGVVP